MKNLVLVAVCLLTGCLARPRLERQAFVFAPPPPAAKVPAGGRAIGIRSLSVAAPFGGRAFIYRTSESAYDSDSYAEFMVGPAEGLSSAIRNWWREAGGFSTVVEAGSALKPDTLVEIQVNQLYGDFRQPGSPVAVLAIHLVFFDAPNGVPGKVLLQRDYSRDTPLKARTAEALVDGWNQALAQILGAAAGDLAQLDAANRKP